MKKTTFLVISLFLSGCLPTQQFTPKQLNAEAKGISTVKSTPYGCRVLGEIEGKDDVLLKSGVHIIGNTLSRMREGAMNDLQNNAVDVVGNNTKRTVIKIVNEKAECAHGYDCSKEIIEYIPIQSYRIKGEIFECGDK